ncbi:hypothetical protein JB92DRAFT_3102393 [Gautieria morchelliformis]|nr:hypothetical protein JB92DRAFT_3102393 [Gautieria morchelliformis]
MYWRQAEGNIGRVSSLTGAPRSCWNLKGVQEKDRKDGRERGDEERRGNKKTGSAECKKESKKPGKGVCAPQGVGKDVVDPAAVEEGAGARPPEPGKMGAWVMGHAGLVGVCELVGADVDEGERRSSLGGAGERRLGEQGSVRRAVVLKRRVIRSGSGRIRLGVRVGENDNVNGDEARPLCQDLALPPHALWTRGAARTRGDANAAHWHEPRPRRRFVGCELKGVKRGWRARTDGSPAGSARPGSRRMPRHARYPGAMHADPDGMQSPSQQRGDTNALPRWHLGGVGALGGSGGS